MKSTDIWIAIGIIVIWGMNFSAGKEAIAYIPPFFLLAIRFSLAGLVMLPFVKAIKGNFWHLLMISFTQITLHFGLLFSGLKGVEAGISSVLIMCEVPFALMLSAWLLNERLVPHKLAAITLTFVAAAYLVFDPNIGSFSLSGLMVLGAALSFAFSVIQMKKITHIDRYTVVSYTTLLAVPQCLLISLIFEHNQWQAIVNSTALAWWMIAYLSFISTVLSTLAWFSLLRKYPVNKLMPFTLLTPVFGVLSGWLFLQETITKSVLLSIAVVMLGVAYIEYEPKSLSSL
jgi:O-acetylserine/cysteine efflux transporter